MIMGRVSQVELKHWVVFGPVSTRIYSQFVEGKDNTDASVVLMTMHPEFSTEFGGRLTPDLIQIVVDRRDKVFLGAENTLIPELETVLTGTWEVRS